MIHSIVSFQFVSIGSGLLFRQAFLQIPDLFFFFCFLFFFVFCFLFVFGNEMVSNQNKTPEFLDLPTHFLKRQYLFIMCSMTLFFL